MNVALLAAMLVMLVSFGLSTCYRLVVDFDSFGYVGCDMLDIICVMEGIYSMTLSLYRDGDDVLGS